AYAIYDEGRLIDINVAGFPSGAAPDQVGRKGPVAYADLAALPSPSPNPPVPYFPNSALPWQVDKLVGWRNYGTTQPSSTFGLSTFAGNFRPGATGTTAALAYWNSIINNPAAIFPTIPGSASGFIMASNAQAVNGRSDQM